MPAASAAAVWVDVLPSMKNFGSELAKDAAGAGRKAGDETGEEMGRSTKEGFSSWGPKIAAAGAAIGVAVGASLVKAMNIDAANDKLAAQLGATPKQAQRYGKAAGKLYGQGYGENLGQVNDAMRSVVQSGVVMRDASSGQLQDVAGKVLNLSEAFGVDLAGSTEAVGQLMKTGMAKNADEALDVVTAGFQRGADRSGDFLDTITEYSAQFSKFGLDAQTATGLLTQGMNAGARSSDLVADAIKEFSIRAVDGTKTSRQGFEALGLSADTMTAKIAKGGGSAREGLDQVLDRLRGIKDPVKQSQIAVQLFGTQAEDLGKSLYALDPSSATKALGDVGGAAQKMGNTLKDNASENLQKFRRQAMQAFVNVVGGQILPVVTRAASILADTFGPALKSVWGWAKRNKDILVPLGIFLGTFGGVLLTAAAAVKAVSLVTRGWAIAQGLLNTVMNANPLVRIIGIVFALGAALVYAYKHSETFRRIVNAAWNGIKTAAMWAWNNVLKPVFGWIVGFLRNQVGPAFSWLWHSVIVPAWKGISTALAAAWSFMRPIFSAIGTIVKILAAVILTILITPVILAWKLLSAAIMWGYRTLIKPAFQQAGQTAQWLWRNVLKPVFGWIKQGWNLLVQGIQWAWANILRPAWNAVRDAAQWLWRRVLQPAFRGIKRAWDAVLRGIDWAWQNILRPAWNAVRDAARFLYRGVIKPVMDWIRDKWDWVVRMIQYGWEHNLRPAFNAVKSAVDSVGKVFDRVVRWIRDTWNKLKEYARKPVQFVVDTVYNNGIRKVWNGIAGTFGLGKLDAVHFAHGGVLPGYAPGRDIVPAMLSPGEGVLTPEAVRAVGADAVHALNAGTTSRRGAAPAGHFAFGGIADAFTGAASWVLGGVKKAAGWASKIFSSPIKVVKDLMSGVLGKSGETPGRGGWTDALKKLPSLAIDKIGQWVKDKFSSMFSGGGGPIKGGAAPKGQISAWIAQALGVLGYPQNYAAGIYQQIMSESGGRPHVIQQIHDVNSGGNEARGIMQVIPPTFAANKLPGHGNIFNPVDNIIAGSRYAMRRYGSSWFNPGPRHNHGYDSGGILQPGWTPVYNGTGKPEVVFTERQWDAIRANMRGQDEPTEVVVHEHIYLDGRQITESVNRHNATLERRK